MFLLTDLFSGLVRPYNELEVDPPKLHARKNGLRITISQMKCSCALITLLNRLVGCVRELFVSTELLTACVVFTTIWLAKNDFDNEVQTLQRLGRIPYCLIINLVSSRKQP